MRTQPMSLFAAVAATTQCGRCVLMSGEGTEKLLLFLSCACFLRSGGMLRSGGTSEALLLTCVVLFTISGFRTRWDLHGGCTLSPDGKAPVPLRACLLPGPPSRRPDAVHNRFLRLRAHVRNIRRKVNSKQTGRRAVC